MSDNYDPLTTQTSAITFRRLDALQDSVAAFGKTSSGSPVAILVATDGTLQTRRFHRLTDEVVLIGTDAAATGRPVLVDTQGRVSFRPLTALPVSDFDGLRAYFLGPAAAQVQGRADADGSLYVIDATSRATLASIVGQLDITQGALKDALLAAIQATQPRSVSNFPADFPDAITQARLQSILGRLDITTSALRDVIAAAVVADQPRHLTNWPGDFPDALSAARLLSILGQLDAKTSEVRDGIAGVGPSSRTLYGLGVDLVAALQATQPRSVSNFPADYPDALSQGRLLSILSQMDRPASEIFDVKTAQGNVTAAANTGGLTVMLDLGPTGRPTVQRFVSGGAGSVVNVQVSRDGAGWRTVETLTFPPSNAGVATLQGNGYRYVRITSASAGVSLDFELSGAR